MQQITSFIVTLLLLATETVAFAPIFSPTSKNVMSSSSPSFSLRMSDEDTTTAPAEEAEIEMDSATKLAMEKQRRANELRAQEKFIQRSTGKHKCNNCDWEYDETKGDSFMIGGLIKPGTPFSDLPANWRCPTCRASKDNFKEVTIEIPGFEVNQSYGFGGNSMTGSQKTGLIFGGLGLFFLLFLAGYGLS